MLREGGAALAFAADKGNIEILEVLIKNGADVNATDDEMGITPLMDAAYMNQVAAVETLLKYGADKNISDKNGKTAIEYATQRKNKRIVKILSE
jgi:ankyrin repeat protein